LRIFTGDTYPNMLRNGITLLSCALLALLGSCFKQNPTANPPSTADSVNTATVKPVIYQLLVRHFSNTNTTRKPWGTLEENGVGKFNGITDQALQSLKDLGVTHVWFTGVLEHATATAFPEAGIEADDADVVKGRLGSPYAIKDYYDVSPALAENPKERMAEFEALVKRTHTAGLKVIMDFVPNHVARSYHSDAKPEGVKDLGEGDEVTQAFAPNNNFYYLPGKSFATPPYDPLSTEKAPGEDGTFAENPAKVTGNNVFSANPSVNDWFETVKLNYGVDMQAANQPKHFDPIPGTWTKMRDILLFWAGKGVDGFRCDVAEMVPVEFWEWVIPSVKERHPATVFIAEIYTPSLYMEYVTKGRFDYLYDKVGLYDKVRPLMEGKPKANITGIAEALEQSESIDQHMLRFLENHDEQRIASKDFASDPKAGIPGMAVTALIGKGPVLIYSGQEMGEKGEGVEGFGGEDGRTSIFDYWGVPAHQGWMNDGMWDGGGLTPEQKELREFYAWLLRTTNSEKAVTEGERFVIAVADYRVYTFIRCVKGQGLLVLANFNPTEAKTEAVKIPADAWKVMVGNNTRSLLGSDIYRLGAEEGTTFMDQHQVKDAEPLKVQVPPLSVRIIALGGDI
jgi:glycosidase